jgi:1-aminocyclopropane-1-carboxylate deaminase/D-cysteine desulfhydrase-like pyridoxal-dependent ACC family enzyme
LFVFPEPEYCDVVDGQLSYDQQLLHQEGVMADYAIHISHFDGYLGSISQFYCVEGLHLYLHSFDPGQSHNKF